MAWLFFGRHNLSHAWACNKSVQRAVRTQCSRLYMQCDTVFCSHSPSIAWELKRKTTTWIIPTLIRLPFIFLLPLRGWRRTCWRMKSPSSSRVNRIGVLLVFIKLLLRIVPSLMCWMDFLSCPAFIRQWLLIECICGPSFQHSFARTILCKFGFSQHITCFVIHHLTHGVTMPASLLRIQESTISQICLCSTVDFFPMAACIFRMCSRRYQFPNRRRNLDIVSSKMSRRTRRFRCCPFWVIKSFDSWLKWLIDTNRW